jgi:hypothetical protein
MLDKIHFLLAFRCSDLIIGIGRHSVNRSDRMSVAAQTSYMISYCVGVPTKVQLYEIGQA